MSDLLRWVVLNLVVGGILTIAGGILFTDSIEVIAARYRLTTSLTGAVISPLLTSLPELFVLVVAIFLHGGPVGENIGLGTVVGEPFMASTIVYPMLVLAAVLGYLRGTRDSIVLRPGRELLLPFAVVTALFPLIVLPTIVSSHVVRVIIGCIMLATYFIYVVLSTRIGAVLEEAELRQRLALQKLIPNQLTAAFVQLSISTAMIFLGSKLLVTGIACLSDILRFSPQLLSIVIVPAVAALPESIVGLVWAFRGRDTLALASIVGEKVLYSTFYPGLAMLITSARLELGAMYCVAITTLISMLMLYYIARCRVGFEVALIGLAGYILYYLLILL